MTFRVVVLDQAEADIEANARWWATRHSVEQATIWIDAVQEQLTSLERFPESYSLAAENDDFPYEIRDALLGLGSRRTYRAVFTIKNGTVYVLAVRRGAQDALHPSDVDSPPSM
jgi:plasmid stabilization system protein ParE